MRLTSFTAFAIKIETCGGRGGGRGVGEGVGRVTAGGVEVGVGGRSVQLGGTFASYTVDRRTDVCFSRVAVVVFCLREAMMVSQWHLVPPPFFLSRLLKLSACFLSFSLLSFSLSLFFLSLCLSSFLASFIPSLLSFLLSFLIASLLSLSSFLSFFLSSF